MPDTEIPERVLPALRWAIATIALFVFFLIAVEKFNEGQITSGLVDTGLFAVTFIVAVKWNTIIAYFSGRIGTNAAPGVRRRRLISVTLIVVFAIASAFFAKFTVPVGVVQRISQLLPTAQNTPATSISISDIKLDASERGTFPYNDKILYSFKLRGTYLHENPAQKYELTVFYKLLGTADQRDDWYAVVKLDKDGFAEINAVPLETLDPNNWVFHTSRIYLAEEARPVISFQIVLLPSAFFNQLSRRLANNNERNGWSSLDFLTGQSGVVASHTVTFEPKPR
jgi:hypothetical protein